MLRRLAVLLGLTFLVAVTSLYTRATLAASSCAVAYGELTKYRVNALEFHSYKPLQEIDIIANDMILELADGLSPFKKAWFERYVRSVRYVDEESSGSFSPILGVKTYPGAHRSLQSRVTFIHEIAHALYFLQGKFIIPTGKATLANEQHSIAFEYEFMQRIIKAVEHGRINLDTILESPAEASGPEFDEALKAFNKLEMFRQWGSDYDTGGTDMKALQKKFLKMKYRGEAFEYSKRREFNWHFFGKYENAKTMSVDAYVRWRIEENYPKLAKHMSNML